MAFIKSCRHTVIPTEVVKIFDLVNPNDPVFTSECFLKRIKLRAIYRQPNSTNAVNWLCTVEKIVVVMVAQLIPIKKKENLISTTWKVTKKLQEALT